MATALQPYNRSRPPADPESTPVFLDAEFAKLERSVGALISRQTIATPITGSRSGGVALTNLLTVLAAAGLITNSTTT